MTRQALPSPSNSTRPTVTSAATGGGTCANNALRNAAAADARFIITIGTLYRRTRWAANRYKTATMFVFPRSTLAFLLFAILFSRTASTQTQNPTLQGHPGDYDRADIEHGARSRRTAPRATAMPVTAWRDLRSGKIPDGAKRPATAHRDYQRLSEHGNAGVPVARRRCTDRPRGLYPQHEYVRRQFDEGGRRGARPRDLRGQGCVPELSSREWQGQPESAGPSRYRRAAQRRVA